MSQQSYELNLFNLRQLEFAINSDWCKVISVSVNKQFFHSKRFAAHKKLFSKIEKRMRVVDRLESGSSKKDRGQIHAKVVFDTFHSSKSWLQSHNKTKPLRLLILDQIQDPQNFGALIRTAKFFAFDAVMFSKKNSAPLSSTVVQASSGALFSMPVIAVNNLKREIDFLKKQFFFCLGFDVSAEKEMSESKFISEDLIIVMGNEGKGMRALTLEACDELYKISNAPDFESLNVSAAAAIAMYKFKVEKK